MITKKQIRKSKSSMSIMIEASKTGQLSENCAIFNPAPGIEFNFSLIKEKPISNNANFDVCTWIRNKQHLPENINPLAAAYDAVMNKVFITKWLASNTSQQRIFTMDCVSGEDADIISYIITATYRK